MKGTNGGINFKIYFNMYVLIECVYAHMPQLACGGQRTTCRNWFSSTIWVLGSKSVPGVISNDDFFSPQEHFLSPKLLSLLIKSGVFFLQYFLRHVD